MQNVTSRILVGRPLEASSFRALRVPGALPLVVAAAFIGCAWIFYLDRHLSFFGDDWTLIVVARQNLPEMLLSPHGGHFLLVHGLLYEALFVTAGLHSYLPYLGLLLAAHAASVVLLFLVVRRRAGDAIALGAAAILLLYGTAAEDLAWAFQVEFILPVSFGLGALLLLDAPKISIRNYVVAAALLTLAIATSGMGIVMFAAVGGELIFDPARRRDLLTLAPGALTFGLWYVLIARSSPPTLSLSRATLGVLPERFWVGLEGAVNGLFGLQPDAGPVALAAIAVSLVAVWAWRRRVGVRAAGPLVGLGVEFLLIGLTRAQFDLNAAASSRYMYVAAVLLLLTITDAVASLPVRWPVVVPLTAIALVSVWLNANQMATFAFYRTAYSVTQAIELRTLEAYRGDFYVTPDDQVDPRFTPITSAEYYDATSAWGSPVPKTTVDDLRALDPMAVDRGLVALFANGLAPVGGTNQRSCFRGEAKLIAPPGDIVLIAPDAGSNAVFRVWAMDNDSNPPSSTTSAPITLWLRGERLPNASRGWHVSVTGGTACELMRAVGPPLQ